MKTAWSCRPLGYCVQGRAHRGYVAGKHKDRAKVFDVELFDLPRFQYHCNGEVRLIRNDWSACDESVWLASTDSLKRPAFEAGSILERQLVTPDKPMHYFRLYSLVCVV